jgi:hypothetical protein
MRKALKEANQELLAMQDKFGAASAQAIDAARKVADLKDRIEDARETADLFDPGKKFQAFVTLGSQIAAGFSAVQGAMALVGAESEDVEKALLKVQSAMALAQGLSQLKDFGKSWQQLNVFIKSSTTLTKANAAATALTSTAMKLFGRSVNTTSTSFRVLKTAIVSTGIGALLVILGEAIGALMEFADSTEDAAAADEEMKRSEERLAQAIEIKNRALEGTIDALNNVTQLNLLRAKLGGASEEQLTDIERKGIEDRIKLRKEELDRSSTDEEGYFENLKKYGNDINELEKFNLNTQIKQREEANRRSQSSNNDALQKRREAEDKRRQIVEQANEAEKQANEDLIKSKLSAREKDLYDLRSNYEKQKKVIEAGGKSSASLTELYNKQKDDINKKYAEEQRKREIEFVNEYNKILEETRLSGIKNVREKEKAELQITHREQLTQMAANENLTFLQRLALTIALRKKQKQEEDALQQKFDQEDLQKKSTNLLTDASVETASFSSRLKLIQDRKALENQIIFASEEERAKFIKENEEATTKVLSDQYGARVQLAKAVGDALGALTDVVGKETAAGKALAIAQATINTFLGITEVWKSKAVLPEPFNTATKIAATVTTAAGGFAAVRNIAKTKVPGAGGGGGPTPPPPGNLNAPMQPGLSPAVQGQALNAQAINDLGNQSLRAYVMNSDIQNNNQRNAYLERNARIG